MTKVKWIDASGGGRNPAKHGAHTLTATVAWGKRALVGAAITFGVAVGVGLGGVDGALARDLTGDELGLYRQAVRAADAGRTDEAKSLAARGSHPIAAKLVRWIELTTPRGGSFSEIATFIKENPEWPAQITLRRRAESELAQGGDPAVALDWFGRYPPVSTDGVVTYAEALIGAGREDRVAGLVRAHWVGADIQADDEAAFVARFGRFLRPQDHTARLSRLLWDHERAAAARMMPLLDDAHDALMEARVALQTGKPDAVTLAKRVPSSLARDPGLLYDLARHLRRKENDDQGAVAILNDAPDDLVRPAVWWKEREIHVRRMLDEGDVAGAYKMAASHRQDDGTGEAEAEFLSGWIALRFANQPRVALGHFETLFNGVSSPISVARGAYWCGRARMAMGDEGEARAWFAKAAKQSTTFYGQLAAEALGRAAADPINEPRVSTSDAQEFNRAELVEATRLLARIAGGDDDRTAAFFRRAVQDAKTAAQYALSARLGRDIGRPDLAIYAAKRAARLHITLLEDGYPVLSMARTSQPEAALTHAIIRQESTFNSNIVSGAGARGLMQLMPATATLVAKKLKIKHNVSMLTRDEAHNVKLGSTYLADQIERFDGSYFMAAAAYNAGPGRVAQWNSRYGDPRTGAVDVVDWIERIPFSETRNYVMRVMEALIVYRQRFGDGRLNLMAELKR